MFQREVNSDFWRGKRVIITGHTGFKGSWLSLWLQSMNAELCGIALEPPTTPSLFNVANVRENMDHQIADIRDYEKVYSVISKFKPEIIFHMAAQPLVRYSYQNPIETYATNVMGTVHILEAARKTGTIKAIVNVTTDKCYENKEWEWGYRENEPMGGNDPYSSSKGCSEIVTNAYRHSFLNTEEISVATARAGNVIGGGDWADDRLIPDILKALGKEELIQIRNPLAVRPWQHVLEPLSGYLLLAENLFIHGQKYAEAWNFGPRDEDAKDVQWIVAKMCELWGREAKWISQPGIHPHEASYLKLDISKVKHKLGWSPRWSLEIALKSIIDWHRAWSNGDNIKNYCFDQIVNYQRAQ